MDAHFTRLMEQLDDIKEHIPEGKYLEFANSLRDTKVLSDKSSLYKITYVDTKVKMNQSTVSIVGPHVVTKTINPFEFFGIEADYIQLKIKKIQETIEIQGYARATRHLNTPIQNSIVNIYWEDESYEPIHVRLDRSRDIIILSLTKINQDRLTKKPDIVMTQSVFKRLVMQLSEGNWQLVSQAATNDNTPTICDQQGRQQLVQQDDGTMIQIVYPQD